jgi:hypothetical protein
LLYIVLPQQSSHAPVTRTGNVLGFSKRAEAIILTAFDRKCFGPVTVQALARIGLMTKLPLPSEPPLTSRKLRAKFLARRRSANPGISSGAERGCPPAAGFLFSRARTFPGRSFAELHNNPNRENKTEREKNSFHKQN